MPLPAEKAAPLRGRKGIQAEAARRLAKGSFFTHHLKLVPKPAVLKPKKPLQPLQSVPPLRPGARPNQKNSADDLVEPSISLGLTDEESALIAGITPETLCRWRRIPEFDQALKRATALRLQDRCF